MGDGEPRPYTPRTLLLRIVEFWIVGDAPFTRTLDEKVCPAYSTTQRSRMLVASSEASSKKIPGHCPGAGAALFDVKTIGSGTVPTATSAPRFTDVPTLRLLLLLNFRVAPALMVSVTRVTGELPTVT